MQTVESVDYMVDTDSMGWWDHQCFLRQFEAPCLVNSRSLVFHHFRHFRLCFMGLSVPKRVIELGCWAPRSVSASDNASRWTCEISEILNGEIRPNNLVRSPTTTSRGSSCFRAANSVPGAKRPIPCCSSYRLKR